MTSLPKTEDGPVPSVFENIDKPTILSSILEKKNGNLNGLPR
jgi:hypothetical protein